MPNLNRCRVPGCQYVKGTSLHRFPSPKDVERLSRWILNVFNLSSLPEDVGRFKHHRVCRRHFTADSFNGECKSVRCDAVPTLHLPCSKEDPQTSTGAAVAGLVGTSAEHLWCSSPVIVERAPNEGAGIAVSGLVGAYAEHSYCSLPAIVDGASNEGTGIAVSGLVGAYAEHSY